MAASSIRRSATKEHLIKTERKKVQSVVEILFVLTLVSRYKIDLMVPDEDDWVTTATPMMTIQKTPP